jgi:choline dehydrogenase
MAAVPDRPFCESAESNLLCVSECHMSSSLYDYVVIGAGSAGCAVAARLAAADPSRTVLLIEAGGSDRRLSVRMPLGYPNQFGGKTDWAFESEPEPGCAHRRITQPRGRVLGGTSSMNAMLWVRGAALDYDGWRLPGWSWHDVEPIFRRIESGPMHITRATQPDDVARRFVAAARAAGVPANDDVSGPDLEGAAIAPVTIWRGQRWSTARGYLDPARKRKNFTLVSGALVHRIVIREGRAIAVEYERNGWRNTVAARAEIVLSAGAYGTPQLLQLSGVGPAEHLRDIGVNPVVDSPHVGAGLRDHPATFMMWDLAPGFVGLSDAKHPKWLLRWLFSRDGKLTSNAFEALAHIRSSPELPAADFQVAGGPVYVTFDGDALAHKDPTLSIMQSYWTPESKGSVLACSADPKTPPEIRLNTLTEPADVAAFVRAIRRTREIVATEPLASAVGAEFAPGPQVRDDDALEDWVRNTVYSTFHPACTAAMGQEPESVLDERLRVRGVAGLRVADASALPRIPRANTNAPSIMVGERCADFVAEENGAPAGRSADIDRAANY